MVMRENVPPRQRSRRGRPKQHLAQVLSIHENFLHRTPVTPVASNFILCLHRHILTNYYGWYPDAAFIYLILLIK